MPIRTLKQLGATLLVSNSLFAADYAELLNGHIYDVAGTFGQYDFPEAEQAFDWAFTAPEGTVYQLQGVAATPESVFGWKPVDIPVPVPAWYMLYLGEDADGDGNTKFDWVLVNTAADAVYKLAGVTETGNFDYFGPIALTTTLSADKTKVFFAKEPLNAEPVFDGIGTYDLAAYSFPPQSGSMTYRNTVYINYDGSLDFQTPASETEITYTLDVNADTIHETSSEAQTDNTDTIFDDRIENLDNMSTKTITGIHYADIGELLDKQEGIPIGYGVTISGSCSLSEHLAGKSIEGKNYNDVLEVICNYIPDNAETTGTSTAILYYAKNIGQIYRLQIGCLTYSGFDICLKSEEALLESSAN